MAVQQQATAWVVGNVAYPPDNAGKGGNHRVRLRVLNNRGWYDRTNREWVERPANGTEVICWGELASNAAASIQVGDPVVVFGRLEENLWTDAEGISHKKTRVVADVVAHDLSRGQARFHRINLGSAAPQADAEVAEQGSGSEAGSDGLVGAADDLTPEQLIDGVPSEVVGEQLEEGAEQREDLEPAPY